ncbi:MAG: hypothetical protein JO317_00260 [Verrucomicrobiae bacterium]|nr:hypothetical protein [Verrucomicrobiae bacterium]
MKKLNAMLLMSFGLSLTAAAVELPFYVYKDGEPKQDKYIPSGWMGDYGALTMDAHCKDSPKSGTSCIKFKYSGQVTQGQQWAGVYWQNPANNWGSLNGGYNLQGATKLKFAARGAKGGEVVQFKIGGMAGPSFSDSDSASSGPLTLTAEWKEYEIDLKGLDLSYILGGFSWTASLQDNPEGFVMYLDEIEYE